MKKHLLLFMLLLGSTGAMAQAFGWTELGTGNNALKATGEIKAICNDNTGEVYAAVYDTGSYYYISKWDGVRWNKLNSNLYWGGVYSNQICADAIGHLYAAYITPHYPNNNWHVDEFILDHYYQTLPDINVNYSGGANCYMCTDDLGNLYAGGNFFPNQGGECILEWDGNNWITLNYPANCWGDIGTISSNGSDIYAAGLVSQDTILYVVLHFYGLSSTVVGNQTLNGDIYSISAGNLGKVYIGGAFKNPSGYEYVDGWDGFNWHAVGDLTGNNQITTMCTDEFGNLFVVRPNGGKIAKWDGLEWTDLVDTINHTEPNGTVYSICTDPTGNLYAAGNFIDSAGYRYVAMYARIDNVKWIRLKSNTQKKLTSVNFPNPNTDYPIGQSVNTGYAAGVGGTILKTTDGGTSWAALNSGTSNQLFSIYFSNANEGLAVGSAGTIIRTDNGGTNWASQTSGTSSQLNSVCFSDTLTGYVVGSGGTILKTTNGGTNWASLISGISDSLYSVYFTNASTGYVVGSSGTILKTTNGGTNWNALTSGTINTLRSVRFINDTTGFAVGDSGTILKTSDGGMNWTTHNVPLSMFLTSVYFTDVDTGYASGANGAILKTTNGGAIWAVKNSGTLNNLSSVFFTTQKVGFAVGDSGTIIKTTINSGTGGINNLSLKTDKLKIYPNPSFDKVTIETTQMPATGLLSVLNMNGVELMRQQVSAPKTVIDVSCFPNGVYVLKLQNETSVRIGKFIKN